MFRQMLEKTNEYSRLTAAAATKGAAALFGLPAPARAMLYAAFAQQQQRPLVVVTAGEAEATRMAEDLTTLGCTGAVFPCRDLVLRPIEGTSREMEYRRLKVLGDLVGGRLMAVCLSVESLLLSTMPPEEFSKSTLVLNRVVRLHNRICWRLCIGQGINAAPK